MRNRGIEMIRAGFELRKCRGSKWSRNDSKRRHAVEFLENIFKKLSLPQNCLRLDKPI
jgi:hypothetical protein